MVKGTGLQQWAQKKKLKNVRFQVRSMLVKLDRSYIQLDHSFVLIGLPDLYFRNGASIGYLFFFSEVTDRVRRTEICL